MHVVFLLGSGISLPAGIAGTAALSEQVLSARYARRWAGTFVVGDGPPPNEWDAIDPTGPLLAFVRDLRNIAERFDRRYRDDPSINYEDIAFLAAQIADCLNFEYENPALDPLIEELAARHAAGDERALAELSGEAREYISGSVSSCLGRPPERLDHLAPVIDCCRAGHAIDLATLNHDTVLEQALRRYGVPFSDGFEREVAAKSYAWTDTFSSGLVRLLKLHGSINWYRLRIAGQQVVVRSDADDPFHLRDAQGELLEFPADGRGQFLAGTFNKILAYQSAVYAELHGHFRRALAGADLLLLSGYGLGDKAINTHLTTFLFDASGRQVVLIHPDPRGALESAGVRPAVVRGLVEAERQGRLVLVEKRFEDASWLEVEEACKRPERGHDRGRRQLGLH